MTGTDPGGGGGNVAVVAGIRADPHAEPSSDPVWTWIGWSGDHVDPVGVELLWVWNG